MSLTEQIQPASEPASKQNYKTLLLEARKLRGRGGINAYKRAKILCQVFDDPDFRAECGNVDDFRAAAILDEYVEDLCLSFLDLRRTLQRFPKPKAWREGRINRLYNEAMKTPEKDPQLPGKPRPVSPETRERLENQLTEARKELACQRAIAVSVTDQLRAKITELEELVRELSAELQAVIQLVTDGEAKQHAAKVLAKVPMQP